MKYKLAFAICLLLSPSMSEGANTVCTNGRCFTCDGAVACNNGNCTCNGVPVGGAVTPAPVPARPAPAPAPQPPPVPSPQPSSAQEAVCGGGGKVMLDTSAGQSPFVYMRLANRVGWFLIDTGATYGSADLRTFGLRADSKVVLNGSSLPTFPGGEFRAWDLSHSPAPGAHIGTIGTDVLGRRTVEFHYDVDKPYMAISAQRCPTRQFEEAGFTSVAQQGYYSGNPQDHRTMQNIPVIFLRIGNVIAPAWVDTGLRDTKNSKHAVVQVNEPFVQKLHLAGIRTQQIGTIENTDCFGRLTQTQVLQVQDAPLGFADRDGRPLFANGPPQLQVRQPSKCGTIAERKEPFGMIGALQLLRWGSVVFDGANERLWITRKRAAVWPEPGYRSMALAWNQNGGFTVTLDDSIEVAKTRAMSTCDEKNGNCNLAGSVNGFGFACLAVARNNERSTSLYYASRGSLDTARAAVLESCAKPSGGTCKLEYSGCND